MKTKKLFAALLATTMIASLAGCSGGQQPAAESKAGEEGKTPDVSASEEPAKTEGSFTYWSAFTGDSATWDAGRVKQFTDANPDITINYQSVPDAAGISNGKLLSALAAGNGPDLIIADRPQSAYAFACNGSFVSWDPYMEAMGMKTDAFAEGYQELMFVDDSCMLIPQDSNVIMLYMRKDHLAEAGLDAANPPKTLKELNEWAEKLTVKNGDNYDRFGFVPWLDSGNDAFTFPYIAGSQLFDPATEKFVLTDDNTVAFYTWLQEYAQAYNPEKIKSFTSSAGGMFSPDHPFMTGSLAMTITGNWFTNSLKTYAPDVEYAVASVPALTEDRYGSTTLGPNVFALCQGVSEDAANAAAAFVGWAITAEANAENFDLWRSVPCADSAFEDVSWTKNGDEIYALERKESNHPGSGVPALTAVSNEFNDQLIATRDNIIYNKVDVKETLQKLQDEMQMLLN